MPIEKQRYQELIRQAGDNDRAPENDAFNEEIDQITLQGMKLKLQAEAAFYQGREYWNRVLTAGIACSFVLQTLLLGFIAFNVNNEVVSNLSEFKNLLYIIAGENFAQIIGLAIIAVKFYFPDGKTPTFSRNPTNNS